MELHKNSNVIPQTIKIKLTYIIKIQAWADSHVNVLYHARSPFAWKDVKEIFIKTQYRVTRDSDLLTLCQRSAQLWPPI